MRKSTILLKDVVISEISKARDGIMNWDVKIVFAIRVLVLENDESHKLFF